MGGIIEERSDERKEVTRKRSEKATERRTVSMSLPYAIPSLLPFVSSLHPWNRMPVTFTSNHSLFRSPFSAVGGALRATKGTEEDMEVITTVR